MESPKEILQQDWQVLAGFWDETTAANFIQGQGVPLTPDRLRGLQEQAKAARDYVRGIPSREKDRPEVKPFHEDLAAEVMAELQSDGTFREHSTGMTGAELAWVELSKIAVFQPALNTTYIKSIAIPPKGDSARLVEFCLPPTRRGPPKEAVLSFNPSTNTFNFITENLDFRILGNVQGEDPKTGRKFVGFGYGGGLPQISVVEYKGRYLLKNGYHRAFSLLKAGHELMPCLLLHTDNYSGTGAGAAGFFPVDTILSDRPPFLGDFSSPASVPIPRRLLRVMITVHAEAQVFPV